MSEPFESGHELRCPYCHKEEPAWDLDGLYEVDDQGTYDMECGKCGKSYDVTVVIDHTFVSPADGERTVRDE